MEINQFLIGHGGLNMGRLYYYENVKSYPIMTKCEDTDAEIELLKKAVSDCMEELSNLSKMALDKNNINEAKIFAAHEMLLRDEVILNRSIDYIKTYSCNVQFAVWKVCQQICIELSKLLDTVVIERMDDINDVCERVLRILNHQKNSTLQFEEPVIIVANSLSPSEVLMFSQDNVIGIVTHHGGFTSHVSLMAAERNIPYLFGGETKSEWHNQKGIIDGENGKLLISPDESAYLLYQKEKEKYLHSHNALKEYAGLPTVTKSGKKIGLYANIGHVQEVSNVIDQDGEGIGLYRTEYDYLTSSHMPTEEELYQIYAKLSESMPASSIVVRTMDLGSDKVLPYLYHETEDNPAMGCRGIRFSFKHKDMFKNQLKAIYRANFLGNLKILYPMISCFDDVKKIKEISREVQEELEKEGGKFIVPKIGLMIETPAAVMISKELAKEVDFFSIGTNDLTQYALAIDRLNPSVAEYYTTCNLSIMRLVEYTVRSAHSVGIPVCICGELAGNTQYTKEFIDMGVDELSVSPQFILSLRKYIRELE